ncbi:hypothetical protein POM88_019017 [Heracleum sosnowskyi]|uniref:Uncharacterized protein n=1 Tax=Heracleum sosnowskyi TaxID=360622 RepID=A0AAD8ITG9_9APIA|nr:hypothetical protein POM88_019017 [Heracleum sosnowskyi]
MNSDAREPRTGSASPAPASVSVASPYRPASRRLSSNFIPFTEPVRAERQLSLVSTRLEKSSSAKNLNHGAAWELFGPIVLVHAAAAHLEKNKLISELQESVQLRDLVLAAMQEELDNLCDQVNYFKDQPDMNADGPYDDSFSGNIRSVGCGCQSCVYHQFSSNDPMGNAFIEESNCEDTFNFQLPLTNIMTSEERRMSNISDWAPSVVSSIDIQLQLDSEQDIYNLRMECEEKDTTIKELSVNLHSSEVSSSKRIAELEGVIRKKKSAITKLKKDMAVLEQKMSYLTRLRRPSSLSSSNASVKQLEAMADDFLEDAESATSPSSSDSDCSPRTSSQAPDEKGPRMPSYGSDGLLNYSGIHVYCLLINQIDWKLCAYAVGVLLMLLQEGRLHVYIRWQTLAAAGKFGWDKLRSPSSRSIDDDKLPHQLDQISQHNVF